jgi:hypothetical protein
VHTSIFDDLPKMAVSSGKWPLTVAMTGLQPAKTSAGARPEDLVIRSHIRQVKCRLIEHIPAPMSDPRVSWLLQRCATLLQSGQGDAAEGATNLEAFLSGGSA